MKKLGVILISLGLVFLVSCGGGGSSSGDGDSTTGGGGAVTYVGTWKEDSSESYWTMTSSTWSFSSDDTGGDRTTSRACELNGTWTVTGSNPYTAINWVIESNVGCLGAPQPGASVLGTTTITVSSDNKHLTMVSSDDTGANIDGATRQ